MKNKIFMLLIILILMIFLPVYFTKSLSFADITDTVMQQENQEKKIVKGLVAGNFNPEYNEETLKAMTLILKWNYKIDPDKAYKAYVSKKDFTEKYEKKDYKKIKNAVNEVYDYSIELTTDAYIEINYITTANTENEIIKNYANPWDLLTKEYDDTKEITGISLNTLNTLCNNGLDYKQALSYFINDIKITP